MVAPIEWKGLVSPLLCKNVSGAADAKSLMGAASAQLLRPVDFKSIANKILQDAAPFRIASFGIGAITKGNLVGTFCRRNYIYEIIFF